MNKIVCLMLWLIFSGCFAQNKDSVKIIPLQFATKDSFIIGGEENKVFYKELYYLLDYKNVDIDTIKNITTNYLKKHLDPKISQYNQYDIYFCKKTKRFNEDVIRADSTILFFQLETLVIHYFWYRGGLPDVREYENGKIIKSEECPQLKVKRKEE